MPTTEQLNLQELTRQRDRLSEECADQHLKYAEARQRAEIAERTLADLQRELHMLRAAAKLLHDELSTYAADFEQCDPEGYAEASQTKAALAAGAAFFS
jgi:hypothetical protein